MSPERSPHRAFTPTKTSCPCIDRQRLRRRRRCSTAQNYHLGRCVRAHESGRSRWRHRTRGRHVGASRGDTVPAVARGVEPDRRVLRDGRRMDGLLNPLPVRRGLERSFTHDQLRAKRRDHDAIPRTRIMISGSRKSRGPSGTPCLTAVHRNDIAIGRHCEGRSDDAIQSRELEFGLLRCAAPLAMTDGKSVLRPLRPLRLACRA